MIYGTAKEREAFNLVVVCMIAGLCFWAAFGITNAFHHSSFGGPGAAISDAPARFYQELMVWEVK